MKRHRMPLVTISLAMTFDGKIAARGKKLVLSGKEDWERQYKLRGAQDALLIGANSVGNYTYSSRGYGKEPLKVILDSCLKTPAKAGIFGNSAKVVICHTKKASTRKIAGFGKMKDVRLVDLGREIKIEGVLRALAQLGMRSVLVEGGGRTIHSFLASGCWDKMIIFVSPQILGGLESEVVNFASGIKFWPAKKVEIEKIYKLGSGFIVEAKQDRGQKG